LGIRNKAISLREKALKFTKEQEGMNICYRTLPPSKIKPIEYIRQ
jgi:hypothetical protein